jgi:branched-chain amino acid transport system permease protein
VIWADAWRVASPTQFTADLSVAVIAIPVIGGLGSLSGAVAAAVTVYMGAFFIGPTLSPLFGNFGHNIGFQLFLAGIGLVAVLLSYPRGMAGAFQVTWQRYLERRASIVATWSPVDVPLHVSPAPADGPGAPPAAAPVAAAVEAAARPEHRTALIR